MLRDYQLDGLRRVDAAFAEGKQAVMLQLATGGGKTALAQQWARHEPTLFICHTLSVISQVPGEFARFGSEIAPVGAREDLLGWDEAKALGYESIACTAQSARFDELGDFRRVIIDEAHHAPDGGNRTTGLVGAAKAAGIPVLGLTATPYRLSRREGFTGTWDTLECVANWIDLLNRGYLADVELEVLPASMRVLGKGNSAGDFATGATFAANAENPVFIERVFEYMREGHSYIIYAVGQEHARQLARAAQRRGLNAGIAISDKTDMPGIETRDAVIRRSLGDKSMQVVINVNKITEGYDCPSVDGIICTRPTNSLALWLQMCGRASRLAEGKTSCHIVDLTDNHERLGHPLSDWYWSLADQDTQDKGDAVLRQCASLDYYTTLELDGSEAAEAGRCTVQLHGTAHKCSVCDSLQGQACARCGKFRVWRRYEVDRYGAVDDTCNLCRMALEHDTRLALEAASSADFVQSLMPRVTKSGNRYWSARATTGWANCFNWQAPDAFKVLSGVYERYNSRPPARSVSVVVRSKGPWRNIVEAHEHDG